MYRVACRYHQILYLYEILFEIKFFLYFFVYFFYYLFVCFFIHTYTSCIKTAYDPFKYLTLDKKTASLFWNLWPLLHQVEFFICVVFLFCIFFYYFYISLFFIFHSFSLCIVVYGRIWSIYIWKDSNQMCHRRCLNIIIIIITT